MNELIIYTVIIAVWFSLQIWVFPKLGIPTCLGGQCSVPVKKPGDPKSGSDVKQKEQEA
mgnify:CR=1 FL=1